MPAPWLLPEPPLPPPGWFSDPERLGGWRYWSGSEWTEHRSDALGGRAAEVLRGGLAECLVCGRTTTDEGVAVGEFPTRDGATGVRWVPCVGDLRSSDIRLTHVSCFLDVWGETALIGVLSHFLWREQQREAWREQQEKAVPDSD